MFNYAPGGIVAFANPDNEQLVPNPIAVSDEAVASGGAAPDDQGIPVALANRVLRNQLMGNAGIGMPEDPEELRKKYIAAHPEYAKILNAVPGEALTKLVGELESQNKSQRERFQQGEGTRGLAALSQALIAAGEATRGQKGMGLGSAFGGFGKSFNQSTLDAEDRAAKQQAAERAQTIETIKLQSDIEGLQRAYAEGNIAKIAEYKKAIQAREEKIATIQGGAAKEALTEKDRQEQRAAQEARYKATGLHENRMFEQAKRANELAAMNKPTPDDKRLANAMARAQGDSVIRSLAKQASDATSEDEYQSILRKIEAREAAIYANAGVKNAPNETKSTVMTGVNEKGETITSTDGGVTWKDAKGKIVK
jgi:hypothetical protein